MYDSIARPANQSDGLIAPVKPNVSGARKNAYKLIRPPSDDPKTPVASRSGRVRNLRSTSGLIVRSMKAR